MPHFHINEDGNERNIPEDWIQGRPNNTECVMQMKTGHVMRVVGLNDPDALRGSGLCSSWANEWDDAKPVILSEGAIELGANQTPGSHVMPAPMAPDGGMGGVLPQRWSPPPRAPGVQETRVNIDLDGYRLGEAVAYHVARA